jgi:hypothetical protein
MAAEAGGPVARLYYLVAGQSAQQPSQLIINRGGCPNATVSVNRFLKADTLYSLPQKILAQIAHICRLNIVDSPSRGMPTMIDCLVEVRVIRNRMVTETQDTKFMQVQAVKMM